MLHDPAALSRARHLAAPVSRCAAAGLPVAHLLDGCPRDVLVALAEILALAAAGDPARLRAAVAADDGATLELISREAMLRAAHAEVKRLRGVRQPVPFGLRVLEGEYQAARRRRLSVAAAAGRQSSGRRDRAAAAAAIREARERAGLSQRHLAALTGVAGGTVRKWEQAVCTPAEQNWAQLELALGPLGAVRARPGAGEDQRQGSAAA